ncbi:MAG: RpiB/LacA/LacB family sugar-phosphate isomerase [Patescibacteria group bacterium]
MNIFIGADHRGHKRKRELIEWLEAMEHSVEDLGAHNLDQEDDYPVIAKTVAEVVSANDGSFGILLCGNAEGVCIVANKIDGVRAGIGYSVEAIRSARNDDNINVLCLPAENQSLEDAEKITATFLETLYEGAERHERRLKKIEEIEKNN